MNHPNHCTNFHSQQRRKRQQLHLLPANSIQLDKRWLMIVMHSGATMIRIWLIIERLFLVGWKVKSLWHLNLNWFQSMLTIILMTISIVGHDHRKSLMIWISISYSFWLIFKHSNDNTASSFKIYSDEHYSRMYYVHMKNVCYNFKNNTILLYKSTDPELSKLTTGNSIFHISIYDV